MDTSTAGASGLKAEHQDDSVDDDSVFESGSNHADQCPPPAIVAVPTASTAGPASQPAAPPPLSLAQTIHAQHRQHILLPQTADPGTCLVSDKISIKKAVLMELIDESSSE